ncbi:MAG: hypothetical protein ACRDQE_16405 [Gaiellales bacterium]
MRVARLLSLAGAMLVLVAAPSVASANSHTFWRASAPNQLWVDPGAGAAGLSVLSVPNIGCTGVDMNGFCTGGIYPSLRGARWIWKTHETVLEQNTSPYGPVVFVRRVDVPRNADNPIHAQIRITADNAYDLFVNGAPVGSGNDWTVITTFQLTGAASLHPGANWLVIRVTNFAGPPAPFENPAALLYKLRVHYST